MRLNSHDCAEADGCGRSNATACPFLENSASRRSLALQLVWGHGKHPSPILSEKRSRISRQSIRWQNALGTEKAQDVGCCFWSSICRPSAWGKLELQTLCSRSTCEMS